MAKNTDNDKKLPINFEIIPSISSLKVNRERDQRVQWTTTASMVISFLLVVSVLINVYQSITSGGFELYAQDIRTSELTVLEPLPPEEQLTNGKIGPPPTFTAEFLEKMDEKERARVEYLNSLYRPGVVAAQVQELNARAAAAQAPKPEN